MRETVCTRKQDCLANSHYGDCESVPSQKPLSHLLHEVDALFSKPQKGGSLTYNYSLGRFPNGWCFTVTNNWYRWSARGLDHQFRVLPTPEAAVEAFLEYVTTNEIDVAELMGEAESAGGGA